LIFLSQPRNVDVGEPIKPAVRIAAVDAKNSIATNVEASVSLALAQSSTNGAVLFGVFTRPATSGIATFPGLSIDTPGQGYVLRATANIAGAVLSVVSSRFNAYVPTSVSLQTEPPKIQFGDRTTFTAAVSPCQSEFDGTAGKIQIWLGRQMLGAASVGRVEDGCQARLPVTFSDPNLPAGTYRLTAVFLSSNPDYASGNSVLPLRLEPLPITLAYTGESLVSSVSPKALVKLEVRISPGSSKSGSSSMRILAQGIFDRLMAAAHPVTVDFYNCSATPCRRIGTAPLRDLPGRAGIGVAVLATSLPVGTYAFTFRVRQTANYLASVNAAQGIVATGETAIDVAAQGRATLRGAGWIPQVQDASGKTWFTLDVRRGRSRVLTGSVAAIYPGIFEAVPADFVIRSASFAGLEFLDRARNEAELTARASLTILNRTDGSVLGGFAAPAKPNLTIIVATGNAPQFGLKIADGEGAPMATLASAIGNSLIPLPVGGGPIILASQPQGR
jgi:hypothetical protein